MRLIPVDSENSIPTSLRCCVCGKWRNSGELYADLDGLPFEAYYCRTDNFVIFDSAGRDHVTIPACANKLIEEGAQVLERKS